ncbi:hypothetical protein H4V97_003037 [Flavobacterium sp. CG_23.5]|uniref:DUF3667 domain-containing protein n=1 Tax=unclassified Flavobacterium TaxID=196869 RepID=UPI0018C98BD7|nr:MULTISPECIES: DUF3667 domain-containing protein [unclassified Flavobacterium]MBG6109685.1 hypothetical protein [Flavobacterium sp. CG_9.10]MBP2284719.1 hypothetical protein [Flavobacterium sp. CG_23.5]
MSKSKIRSDKTCLNCRYVVENKFCPNCGQENTDTRKTFHHLFIHFFEDLTHYENAFWKTIRNLLFKPATLTKEYLSGKRLSYLAPVRLYIFISFITFFLIAIFPNKESEPIKIDEKKPITITNKDTKKEYQIFGEQYKSVKELDSLQKYAPQSNKLDDFSYWITKKVLTVTENNSNQEIIKKFLESFLHNLPKVLFIFMPLFAFFLWLFHNKKRWYYFDHGIFTLHYFSFLLLIFLILFLITKLFSLFALSGFASFIEGTINFIGYSWMVYYFFPAHHRFYGETRLVSFIKSSILFLINAIIIVIILTLYAIYTFINLH